MNKKFSSISMASIILASLLAIGRMACAEYYTIFTDASYPISEQETNALTSNLKGHRYQLHFIPLPPRNANYFTSSIIEFSETDSTFSLTLFSVDDHIGITYHDCPYEAYGSYSPLFVGHQPDDLDCAGFTITGITLGCKYLIGIFQFRLITFPPIECSYLFRGRKIGGEDN